MMLSLLTLGVALSYSAFALIGILRPKRRIAMFEIALILAIFALVGYSVQGKWILTGVWTFNTAMVAFGLGLTHYVERLRKRR